MLLLLLFSFLFIKDFIYKFALFDELLLSLILNELFPLIASSFFSYKFSGFLSSFKFKFKFDLKFSNLFSFSSLGKEFKFIDLSILIFLLILKMIHYIILN